MSHDETRESAGVITEEVIPAARQQRPSRLIVILMAILAGLGCSYGYPYWGSFIAIPFFLFLLYLLWRGGRERNSWVAAALALISVAAVALDPGLLNVTVCWVALGFVVLCQQGGSWRNPTALILSSFSTFFHLPNRLLKKKVAHPTEQLSPHSLTSIGAWILPIVILLVFGWLLTLANPLISQLLSDVVDDGASQVFTLSFIFFGVVAALAFSFTLALVFSPVSLDNNKALLPDSWYKRYLQPGPVLVTLALLNLMFALQNLLDVRYVWLQDKALPAGMSYAAYVHRGSYTLIVTAILAAILALLLLRPVDSKNQQRLLHGLIYLWLGQTIALVVSSIIRTLSYVDAYGMSYWRLAGLLWMGLVMAGLVFIILRIVFSRNNSWLLNCNIAASFGLLLVCGFVDFPAIIAAWNVERAIAHAEAGDASSLRNFDSYYAASLGPAALPAVRQFEAYVFAHHVPEIYLQELAEIDGSLHTELTDQQAYWLSWNWRHSRRDLPPLPAGLIDTLSGQQIIELGGNGYAVTR